jgi:tRNA (uracil-5-)-methyltransferase
LADPTRTIHGKNSTTNHPSIKQSKNTTKAKQIYKKNYSKNVTSANNTITDEEYNNYRVVGEIGFEQRTSRHLIDVKACAIVSPAINEAYQRARAEIHREAIDAVIHNYKRKKGAATLLFRQGNIDDPVEEIVTDPTKKVLTIVNGYHFRYRAGNFFQNNYYVLKHMVDHVRDAIVSPTSSLPTSIHSSMLPPSHHLQANHLHPLKYVVDCYCGSGMFAITVARMVEKVIGIEINRLAVEEATLNAKLNNITNCEFIEASADTIFASPLVASFSRDNTAVIIDPPRKGCSPEFLQQLFAYAPQRIVYMSCDPTTQARDAKIICHEGNYLVTMIQPFDLFPQTRHVECLMTLEKIGKDK